MYNAKDDEKPIIDNLLRAYAAPLDGSGPSESPDFASLLRKLQDSAADRRTDATVRDQAALSGRTLKNAPQL